MLVGKVPARAKSALVPASEMPLIFRVDVPTFSITRLPVTVEPTSTSPKASVAEGRLMSGTPATPLPSKVNDVVGVSGSLLVTVSVPGAAGPAPLGV